MKKQWYWLMVVWVMMFTWSSNTYAGGKILYVDSYHEGYAWSDGITKGVRSVLSGADVELRIFRMDTKKNKRKSFMRKMAMNAKAMIEEFKPDVVIASDDNASRYLIKPFYKDAELPFVFCGLNWDASAYGFPCKNVTGMIEVASVPKLLEYLKPFAKGDKIAYLAADVLTSRKEGRYYRTLFKLNIDMRYVKNFASWAKVYEELQDACDILIVGNKAGINDWDDNAAERIVMTKTKVPTGTLYDFMGKYALIGYTKIAEEQGEWAAKTALRVLGGTDISTIPISKNKKGNLIVNNKVAGGMKITLPESLILEAAQVIE